MAKTRRTSKHAAKKSNQNMMWIALAAIVVLLVGGFALIRSGGQTATTTTLPAEISVQEAYKLYQDGTFVLDVRTPEEWNDFHAPNTTLIPLDELESRVNELPKDREIVVICRSGNRSAVGRDILLNAGFSQVTSVDGGLTAWRAAGYPVE